MVLQKEPASQKSFDATTPMQAESRSTSDALGSTGLSWDCSLADFIGALHPVPLTWAERPGFFRSTGSDGYTAPLPDTRPLQLTESQVKWEMYNERLRPAGPFATCLYVSAAQSL